MSKFFYVLGVKKDENKKHNGSTIYVKKQHYSAAIFELDYNSVVANRVLSKPCYPNAIRITKETRAIYIWRRETKDLIQDEIFHWIGGNLRKLTAKEDIIMGNLFGVDYDIRKLWGEL